MKGIGLIRTAAAVSGVVLLAAGCGKEVPGVNYAGQEVVITSKAPSASSATKTEYSGYTEGSKVERINWIVGDVIRMCSDKANVQNNGPKGENYGLYYSDYRIDNVTEATGNDHVADKLSPVLGNGLVWVDNAAHRFWGVYPAPGSEGAPAGLDITGFSSAPAEGAAVTATLPFPAAQTATRSEDRWLADLGKGGFMLSAAEASAPATGGTVNFDFKAAFTAFEFVFGADTEMQVTGFEMYTGETGTALSGTATATLVGTKWEFGTVARTAENSKISVTFSEPIKLVPEGSTAADGITEAHLTVLGLPQDLSGITIKFITNAGNRTLKLTQKGEWVTFKGRNKAYIKGLIVPGTVWMISLDPTVKDWTVLDDTINLLVD